MVTVKVYSDSVLAGLAQSLLESRGMQAVLLGFAGSNMMGEGADPNGGIRLQVFEDDVAEALRILKDGEGVIPLTDDFVPPEEEPA